MGMIHLKLTTIRISLRHFSVLQKLLPQMPALSLEKMSMTHRLTHWIAMQPLKFRH